MPIYATKRAWNCFFDRPDDGSDGDCGWRSESVFKWPAPITIHFYSEVGFRNRLDDALAQLGELLGYEFNVVDASGMSMFDRNNYNETLDRNSILVELRDDDDAGGNRLGYAEWWVYRSRHEFSVARVVVAGRSSNLNATIMHEMVHALTGMGHVVGSSLMARYSNYNRRDLSDSDREQFAIYRQIPRGMHVDELQRFAYIAETGELWIDTVPVYDR